MQFHRGSPAIDTDLLFRIKAVLPTRKLIWLLIDRFYSHLYPFMPYLDESLFRADVARMLGKPDDPLPVVAHIHVDRRLDFALLGTLLLLLRVASLSYFSNSKHTNAARAKRDPTMALLQAQPVLINVGAVAQDCLNSFNLMKNVSLTVMQLALFTRVYRIHAPEEGDGVDSSENIVFNAMLVQMAYQLGLNRDPDKFPDVLPEPKVNNVARKIWYFLLTLDINNCLSCGLPLNVRVGDFDTRAPFHVPGNENTHDLDMELFTLSRLDKLETWFRRVSSLVTMILNMTEPIRVELLVEKMNVMDRMFRNFFNALQHTLREPATSKYHAIDRSIKLKIYFSQFYFHVMVNFHLFRHYEHKKALTIAYFYFKKMMVLLVADMMPFHVETMFANREQQQHPLIDLVINPMFIMSVHLSVGILTTLYMRLRIGRARLDAATAPESAAAGARRLALLELIDLVWMALRVMFQHLKRLSSRYYHAWRITRAQKYLLHLYRSEEFYQGILSKPRRVELEFDDAQIYELLGIFRDCIRRISELSRPECDEPLAGPVPHHDEPHVTTLLVLELAQTVPALVPTLLALAPAQAPTQALAPALATLYSLNDFFVHPDHDVNEQNVDSWWLHLMHTRHEGHPYIPEQHENGINPHNNCESNGAGIGMGTVPATFNTLYLSPRASEFIGFNDDLFDIIAMDELMRTNPQ